MDKFLKWFKAALVRAFKTFLQSFLSMLTVGSAISEIDFLKVLSVSLVAALYSFVTSAITGLPEIKDNNKNAE